MLCKSCEDREGLINHLKEKGFQAVFHYLSLHTSEFVRNSEWSYNSLKNIQSDFYMDNLLRLPFYGSLKVSDQELVVSEIINFDKVIS